MRNLKKTLCLLLALVFVLGLCTAGAVGTYGDEDKIQYETAVKAMSGLGILQGDDNDGDGVRDFRPADPVTRAQAAKIIAYIVLGKENAEVWPKSDAFTDVSENHWANKYIAFCKHQGIIDGMGDGTFHPDDNVTQVAFAKMLLASAGYGAKGEFTGAGWDQNVVSAAIQNKVQKGLLRTEWKEPATREETAQLAYNGLMNVVQVVLSKDTESYVPKSVSGGTFASAVWSLETAEGVVTGNKTNTSAGKGTVLSGTQPYSYFVTEADSDASKLGHKVSIIYRVEKESGTEVAVAYYVDDACTEVSGTVAETIDDEAVTYNFVNGQISSSPIPPKSARKSAPGVFVLSGDGKVVAYKEEAYFIAALTQTSGSFTVTEPYTSTAVKVNAPAGAKSGDMVTVFKNGDVYTAQAITKKTGVTITQSAQDKTTGRYTYNDGAIYFTGADKFNLAILPAITKLDGTNQLELGSSYTLYFDSKGGCIGFSDKLAAGVTMTSECVYLVARFTGTDSYGGTTYRFQVLRANGAKEDLPVAKASYDLNPAPGVYKLGKADEYYTLTAAGSEEYAYTTYSTENPVINYDSAVFVWFNGSLGSLQVKTTEKPKEGSPVYYTYKEETVGTVTVKRIGTVWFTTAAATAVTVNDSYIYVAGVTVESTRLVDGASASFYPGYMNGEKMADLRTEYAPGKIGFATYTKDSKGVYTLSYLPDGNGTATGVRTGTLVDQDTSSVYILTNTLYMKDTYGVTKGMDLTGVKVVKVGAAESIDVTINSIDTLQAAMLNGSKITITFVEAVDASGNHSIGGKAIYVTGIV